MNINFIALEEITRQRNIVIYGYGEYGKALEKYLSDNRVSILSIVDDSLANTESLKNIKILTLDQMLSNFNDCSVVLSILNSGTVLKVIKKISNSLQELYMIENLESLPLLPKLTSLEQEDYQLIPKLMLKNTRLNALDIGAAIGVQNHWIELLGFANIYAIEPCNESAQKLRDLYDGYSYSVIEDAVADTDGTRIFYITNVPTGSSLLRPNLDYIYAEQDYFLPWKEVQVNVKSLQNILNQNNIGYVDIIKIDTQGTELDILQGLDSAMLEGVLCVEFEAGLPGAYIAQKDFLETHKFMLGCNFDLFDLRPAKARLQPQYFESRYKKNHTASSKVHEVDVLYFKKLQNVLLLNNVDILKKLLVLYCVYSYFDEALYALEQALSCGIIDIKEKQDLCIQISKWHDYKSHFWYHWFNY